jgi:hypothetical protein
MRLYMLIGAAALAITALGPVPGEADTISSVENARAKERQGRWLDRQEREQLRRWGGNDDYGYHPDGRYARGYRGYESGPIYHYRAYPF